MRYHVLATDYDGTIATRGEVDEPTLEALRRLRASGRKLILVTGRELEDLLHVFPPVELFDRVVAENGAVVYRPDTREETLLDERPPEEFPLMLRERGVQPVSTGRVIVATWHPHETTVLETIRDMGLELQVIFNKGAVMVLPSGVNKATGMVAALRDLGLSPHNAVGVGDAENDHAFLRCCECSVAVANALPTLKEQADWVTERDHGAGVSELIDRLLATDLSDLEPSLQRHHILLGTRDDTDEPVQLPPYGVNVLLAGTAGAGKTTLATGVIERLLEREYQLCVIDPEGDYANLERCVVIGDSNRSPSEDEILGLLEKPEENVVVNLLGVGLQNRPAFFEGLLPRLQELRARTGRPHWIVLDEVHHLLPSSWEPTALLLPQSFYGLMMITVQPDHVSRPLISLADLIIAIGEAPDETVRLFTDALGQKPPALPSQSLEPGQALLWSRREPECPIRFRGAPTHAARQRHVRKYAEGELPPEGSFYFQGPDGRLNLRAQNLMVFIQIAQGVDDETWLYHLRRGDYALWFREVIKDDELAAETDQIAANRELSAAESRAQVQAAIERRYTAPA